MGVTERASAGLTIELLPARQGDAVLVSWGPSAARRYLLVDGGPARAYDDVSGRLTQIPGRRLELLVMTHIDTDHIEGTLLVARDADLAMDIGEVWFNGPAQLSHHLGESHGEMFAALIQARQLPWNSRFGGRAVRTSNVSDVVVKEIDGLRITVAGPDGPALAKLTENWVTKADDEWQVYKSGDEALAALQAKRSLTPSEVYLGQPAVPGVYDLANEPAAPDTSYTNASSIVLLLEHEGRTALLTGDATPPALDRAVDRLLAAFPDGLNLDVLKLPHHGSARNTAAATLRKIPAAAYLFSSSGGKHGRPHPQAVARCLQFGNSHAELVFNYRSPATMFWDAPERRSQKPYSVRYPDPGSEGVAMTLAPGGSS